MPAFTGYQVTLMKSSAPALCLSRCQCGWAETRLYTWRPDASLVAQDKNTAETIW